MSQEEWSARWTSLRDEMHSNKPFVEGHRALEVERRTTLKEMNATLADYLSGKIGTAQFRGIFDQKTRTDWDSFGLRGPSGAMFLNMLVRNIPDQAETERQIKAVLPLPTDVEDGYRRLTRFMDYLAELNRSGIVPKGKVQPARAPFFFSAWWHMQNVDAWPIHYISARKALAAEGNYTPLDQPVEDYFAFREAFLTVAEALGLSTWEMEHLCVWHEESSVQVASPIEPVEVVREAPVLVESQPKQEPSTLYEEESKHSHIQWLLAQIGRKFGYNVWIAANDRKRTWNGEALGKYSVNELPYFNGVGPKSQRMIELIDVVWLKGFKIVAAFEVESTTSIFSGLLRMSDLSLALDNFIFPLYIAVPESRVKDVQEQLSRITFQRLELHERCHFFTFERLIEEAEPMMRYASDVRAIDKISQQVPELNQEGY